MILVAVERGEILADAAVRPVLRARFDLAIGRAADFFAYVRDFASRPRWRPNFAATAEIGAVSLRDEPEAPVGKIVSAVDVGMSAAEGYAAIAMSCLSQYSLNAPLLRGPHAIEALHQARVALRRLRSAVTLFSPILRDGEFPRLRAELKWLFAELGEARDLDVLSERIAAMTPQAPAEVLAQLEARRAAAHERMLQSVESSRTSQLLFDLAAWIAAGEWRRAADPDQTRKRLQSLGAYAASRLRKRRAAFLDLVESFDALDEEGLHALRIETKKLRYAAEFMRPLADGSQARARCSETLAALADLQETLGQIHDIDAPPEIVGAPPTLTPPDGAIERARLATRARRQAKSAARVKPFWSRFAEAD